MIKVLKMILGAGLLDKVEGLIDDVRDIALAAKQARRWQAAVGSLREVKNCLELLGRLSGELKRESSVNANLNSQANYAQFEGWTRGELQDFAERGTVPERFTATHEQTN